MIFRGLILSTFLLATATVDAQEGCSVCGPDMQVGNLDGIFSIPGQPTVPCSLLELAGEAGVIPLDQCPFLPPLIQADCACEPAVAQTDAP